MNQYISKEYDNYALEQIAIKAVNQMQVRDVYKPLLVDIILRRAYEYNLSPIEAKSDVNTLMHNLKSIKIEKMPYHHKNAAGVYIPWRKSILISKDLFEEEPPDYEQIYETLTHEVYHALSRNAQGFDKLSSINKYTKTPNVGWLEAVISKSSNRAVVNRTSDNMFYKNSRYGYQSTVFALDLVAAVYGMSELEFLIDALRGKSELIKALAYKRNVNMNDTADFIEAIEANLIRLHNVSYFNKPPEEMNSKERKYVLNEITQSLSGISIVVERHINYLYNIDDKHTWNKRMNSEDEFQYAITKIDCITHKTLEMFSRIYNYDFRPDYYRYVEQAMRLNAPIFDYINFMRQQRLSYRIMTRIWNDDFGPAIWDNSRVCNFIREQLTPEAKNPLLARLTSLGRKLFEIDEPELKEFQPAIDRLKISRRRMPNWNLTDEEQDIVLKNSRKIVNRNNLKNNTTVHKRNKSEDNIGGR